MTAAAGDRPLRGRFLQGVDGNWFWEPLPDTPPPPPQPVAGQLLRPVGQEDVLRMDAAGQIARGVRPARWVDAYSGAPAQGEPR